MKKLISYVDNASLLPPSKSLSANATTSIHASTLYTKLKTFIILLLFFLKLTTFSIPLTLNTFQLQTFFINFLIITQTIKMPSYQPSALLSANCLSVNRVPYCQQTVLVSAECLTVSKVHYCQQSALLSAECLQYSFINTLPLSTEIKLKLS